MLSYPETPNNNISDDDAIARALGIEDLRTGRHFLRDERRVSTGSVWVSTCWLLRIMPSFNHHGLLAVVVADGETLYGNTTTGWIKAYLESDGAFAVQDLDADPLPNLVSCLPLLSKSKDMYLDGIGYHLRIQSLQINSDLDFANPNLPEFVALEKSCWKLARTIARSSGDKTLKRFAAVWKEYQVR